jgi:hypothetical protein
MLARLADVGWPNVVKRDRVQCGELQRAHAARHQKEERGVRRAGVKRAMTPTLSEVRMQLTLSGEASTAAGYGQC